MLFVTVETWQSPFMMPYEYHCLGCAAIEKSNEEWWRFVALVAISTLKMR
jgi:hypothetical protein